MTIDPESEKFIAFALNYLENDEVRHEFFKECANKFKNFISRNPHEISDRLKAKLERGAEEHGAPIYQLHEVDTELEYEFLDILGWSLVRLYNERKVEQLPAR